MKTPQPLDLQTIVRTFGEIPELARAGALAGANALYLEHIENPLGRFSLDIDLFAVDQQRDIDWEELIARAARAPDNDYNPLEFLGKLQSHSRDGAKSAYLAELPVRRPPAPAGLREFIGRLTAASQEVARAALIKKLLLPNEWVILRVFRQDGVGWAAGPRTDGWAARHYLAEA